MGYSNLINQSGSYGVFGNLKAALEDFDYFVVPHHTSRAKKHGEICSDIYPGTNKMPVIEIASKWGSSEFKGNPTSLIKQHDGPSCVQDFLNRGYMLGFIGGTDTHQTLTFIKDEKSDNLHSYPAFTAVFANELTREGIFNGIKIRSCYAATLERIYLDFNINGTSSGDSVKVSDVSKPRTVNINVAAMSNISKIEIIRNGKCIYTYSADSWNLSHKFIDSDNLSEICLDSEHLSKFTYYYVRITCISGANAWSSPIWFLIK